MFMLRRFVPCLALLLFAGGVVLRAEDEVYVKGKDKAFKGKVSKENAKEVIVGKNTVPAEDIIDVWYELATIGTNIPYRQALKKEKESHEPGKDRKTLMGDALKGLEDVLPNVKEPEHRRHVEFKIAMIRVRHVQEDGEAPEKAIKLLRDFAKKHAGSWEISHVYQTLGRMQVDTADFDGAADTYTRLSKLDGMSDDVRQDAKLLAIQARIQGGKFDDARDEIAELQKDLPKGSRFLARARVAEAECLVAEAKKYAEAAKRAKLFDQSIGLIQGVIKGSNDKYVKAVGHNTLGYCYLEQGKPKDARWEFLWVTVVYNQDRVQRAKAFYYLWDIAVKDGDATEAQKCREELLSPEYGGLEYQQKVKDAKSP
jgi:tetratricopeptide (TPR) repeat protein